MIKVPYKAGFISIIFKPRGETNVTKKKFCVDYQDS